MCAPLLLMDLCRVSVCGSVSRHIVEVMGRAARRVRKARVRSAASTRWVLARSVGWARAYLIELCRAARASRELRHADGGNQMGLVRAPNRARKFHHHGGDSAWQRWLLTRASWEAAARAAVTNDDGGRV